LELKQIKELMGAMGRTGIKKVSVKEGDFELHLEREEYPGAALGDEMRMRREELVPGYVAPLPPVEMHIPHHHPLPPTPHSPQEPDNSKYVASPMVGTFYSSPSPDSAHFVKVGDTITENSVVCIVEAMKVMNEVKAGVSGVVTEILLQSGNPVEFGTKLFRVL